LQVLFQEFGRFLAEHQIGIMMSINMVSGGLLMMHWQQIYVWKPSEVSIYKGCYVQWKFHLAWGTLALPLERPWQQQSCMRTAEW